MTRFLSAALLASLVAPAAGTTAKAADLDEYGPPAAYERRVVEERPVAEDRRIVEERRIIEERPVVVERRDVVERRLVERPLVERRVYIERPVEVDRPVVYPGPSVRVLPPRYPRPHLYARRWPRDAAFQRFGYGPGPYGD